MSLPDAVDLLAPPLTDQEVIYYQSLLELAAGGFCLPRVLSGHQQFYREAS